MITAIFMASGLSYRYGRNKLLEKICDKEIFRYTLESITNSKVNEVIVITSFLEIINYCKENNIKYIYNKNPNLGQSQSIKLGVKNSVDSSNYMFFVADQPLLSKNVINIIIKEFLNNPSKIIVPVNNKNHGNPKIFPNWCRNSLLELTGDNGGRSIIKSSLNNFLELEIEIKDKNSFLDIDTIDDYNKIKDILKL